MNASPIDFYFDFSSPYSYIASEWIDALAARHGRTVEAHAILLGASFQVTEIRTPVSYPLKGGYTMRDFERSARFEGVPLQMPTPFPIPTQNAARVFWWLKASDPPRARDWARHALRAYFVRGVALNDPAALRDLAVAFGLDGVQVEAAWNDTRWKLALKQANEQAIERGVFGAPFFFVDGEAFWGNDRKPMIERWLAQGPF